MTRAARPTAPHQGIYRWQVTNSLSILHRLTGAALSIGLLVYVCWLLALASGAAAYADVHAFYSGMWFKLPLAGWIFCLFYHLANGIRHLFWDVGLGFSHAQIRAGGWAVVTAAVVATGVYALLVLV